MNDARVDSPTPGPSSVEAYEEDWYRSLRALAERRRSELGALDDEPEGEKDASASASSHDASTATLQSTSAEDARAAAASTGADVERGRHGGDAPRESSDAPSPGPVDHPSSRWAGVLRPLERLPVPPPPAIKIAASDDAAAPADVETAESEQVGERPHGGLDVVAPDPSVSDEEPVETSVWPHESTDGHATAASAHDENEMAPPDDVGPDPDVDEPAPPETVAIETQHSLAPNDAAPAGPLTEPEPAGPSLTSRDPAGRRTAVAELAEREPTAAELDTVAALILDPDVDIRRLAVEALARTPARLDDHVVRQALQDPSDEVRAAAVRAAATRGIRDLPILAPLVDARRSPETHRAVLEVLPKILGEALLTAEALYPLLLAVAQMQPPPDEHEREALAEIAASIGSAPLIEGLMLPDVRRLGAVRLLAGDRSHAILHALADLAGDPLAEVRQAGLAAAEAIKRLEKETARAAGPPDIGAVAAEPRSSDAEDAERARSTLAQVARSDLVTWARERLSEGDAESVVLVASVAAELDLGEIGAELLTHGASLPPEDRRLVIEALAEFPDPSRLAATLGLVPPDKRADAVRLVWEASGRRVLPDLRSLLADPVVEVRVAVIDITRDADDRASTEAVARLLASDASPQVRAAAVRATANAEGALRNVIGAVDDRDPHVRAMAVESMPASPAAEVGLVLAKALTDLDERVRFAAVERLTCVSSNDPEVAWSALRECRPQERTDLLQAFQRTSPALVLEIALEHLSSPDQEERTLAAEMTGWGASEAAAEPAIRALGDPVPEVRRAAVEAVKRLRDRSAVQALGKTLADPDPDVRVGAVRALGVVDDEGVLAFLVAALKDPDHRVRETTSQVLTEWSSPAVAKRLAGVLAVPSLRDGAADLLRRIGPTSVELLIDVLLQANADLRPTVGPLLEQIIGIDEFLGRTDSLDPERRLRAIEALGAIAGPVAVDALMRSLSDPDERIRLRATQLLGELGDTIAAEAMRRLVDDPVPDVAAAARHALETNLDSRGADRG